MGNTAATSPWYVVLVRAQALPLDLKLVAKYAGRINTASYSESYSES